MLNDLLFCECCRKKVVEISQLQFVEENSDRGFCSENCILEFYKPFMEEFSQLELNIRQALGLDSTDIVNNVLSDEKSMEEILKSPTEQYKAKNSINQSFTLNLIEINFEGHTLWYLAVLAYYEDEPSFIYFRTTSRSRSFVDKFISIFKQAGQAKPEKALTEFQIPSEWLEEVENKKSQVLAHHLMHRSESDIPFEEFYYFDKYLEETLDNPDEVYSQEDDEGDLIFVNIKSFLHQEKTFFYIVLGMKYHDKKTEQIAFLPILGFPTIDEVLYTQYTQGNKISGKLKN